MRTGRNEPCPCKSGRKYKTCCLKAESAQAHDDLKAQFARMHQQWQESTEPLTATVIDELVARDWTREDLQHAAAEGARYDRARRSLRFPLELELV